MSARELIALAISPGRDPSRASAAAEALAARYGADGQLRLGLLSRADVAEIARAAGIGRGPAARLLAGMELGQRAAQESCRDRVRLGSARDVYERIRPLVRDLRNEEFWLLCLDAQQRILRESCVVRGLLDEAPIHPREVFRLAIAESAASIVIVHNHPGGEPSPSSGDDAVTEALVEAGHLVGICVIDHIIIGDGRYYSYNEAGRIPVAPVRSFACCRDVRLRRSRPGPRARASRAKSS